MQRFESEMIELTAVTPDADLACDFTIANAKAREGLTESLERAILRPVRRIARGVEVRFSAGAWDDVRRYVELESQCCSFLTFKASRTEDAVVLQVTGRPDARALIENIFGLDR